MTGSPLQSGDVLDQYRIIRALGAGGMGEVYLADDERLGRRVAVKILPAQWAGEADRVRRFEQEARIVSSLNHPNIVTLFDVRQSGARWLMATEFVEGRTLRAEIESRTRLPLADAVDIALQCAEALAAAHAAGIVHRDVKPDNVMLRRDGWVKVLDFGLARVDEDVAPEEQTRTSPEHTSAGAVLGTVNYLSPEQARGQRVDARTDVFSLGLVFYEMLTGVHPFKGTSGNDTIAAILRADPMPVTRLVPGLPRSIEGILDRALAKDLDRRYASVEDFARDLRALVQATAHGAAGRSRVPRRHLVLAAIVLAAAAGGWAAWKVTTGRVPTTAIRAEVRTLAVLPFKVIGGGPGDEHLGLGLADALIVKLTNLRQLTVRPTNAVLPYEAGDPDAGAAGRALQVDAVLSGTVQRAGDRIRITAQLIRTPASGVSAEALWSDVFPETTGDLFDLQDRLAAHLVERLALQLSGDEQQRLVRRGTSDALAYQLYMEGRLLVGKRSADGARDALGRFEQAIARDPGFALAHIGVAMALTHLMESRAEPESALVRARASLDHALALDKAMGEAHALKGTLARVLEWKFEEADEHLRLAMTLEPGNPWVLQWAGVHQLALGRGAEAVALHERAFAIDPTDPSVRSQLARAYYLAKRYEDAIATGRALIRLDESQSAAHQWVGQSLAALGRHDEALLALRRAVALAPTSFERQAALAHGLAVAGRHDEARAIVRSLQTDSTANAYQLATVYVGLGDVEAALTWLARAQQQRNGFLANRVAIDPKLDPVRSDARFQAILRAAGLTPGVRQR